MYDIDENSALYRNTLYLFIFHKKKNNKNQFIASNNRILIKLYSCQCIDI